VEFYGRYMVQLQSGPDFGSVFVARVSFSSYLFSVVTHERGYAISEGTRSKTSKMVAQNCFPASSAENPYMFVVKSSLHHGSYSQNGKSNAIGDIGTLMLNSEIEHELLLALVHSDCAKNLCFCHILWHLAIVCLFRI